MFVLKLVAGYVGSYLVVLFVTWQSSPNDLVIQVVLIAESVRLQQLLATYGIQTQTPHQIEPIQIWPPVELAKAYEQLGVNDKLGLSGRPPRPIGGLGTAKVKCLIMLNHYFMSYFVFLSISLLLSMSLFCSHIICVDRWLYFCFAAFIFFCLLCVCSCHLAGGLHLFVILSCNVRCFGSSFSFFSVSDSLS